MVSFFAGCPLLVPRKRWRRVILSACSRCWCSYNACATIPSWWHQERTSAPTSAPLCCTVFHHWCWELCRRKTTRLAEIFACDWGNNDWMGGNTLKTCTVFFIALHEFAFFFYLLFFNCLFRIQTYPYLIWSTMRTDWPAIRPMWQYPN